MANLTETSTFDSGVYQIETTDPVLGGPTGVTNTPLKNLANRTRWLKDQVDALAAELAGVDFSIYAPKASPTFSGNPAAPTPPQFDNDTSLATTEFVQRALGNVAGQINYASSSTIPASAAGKRLVATAANITLTLPLLADVPVGTVLLIKSTVGTITVQRQGTDTMLAGYSAPTSISVAYGECVTLIHGNSNWCIEGGDVLSKVSPLFGSSIAANGYQKLPSGLIVQWGTFTGNGTNTMTGNFPIAFPNAVFASGGQFSDKVQSYTGNAVNFEFTSTSSWRAYVSNTVNLLRYSYFAIGN